MPPHRIDWSEVQARLAQTAIAVREAVTPSPERADMLLRERARRLAQPLERGRPPGKMLDLLTFRLAPERYGIETRLVREVVRFSGLTPVPGVSELVAGLLNLRGALLLVFDIGPLLGLRPREAADAARIVVCGDGHADFGILVDAADDVTRLPLDSLQPHAAGDGVLVRGLAPGPLAVLDGAALLAEQRLSVSHQRGL